MTTVAAQRSQAGGWHEPLALWTGRVVTYAAIWSLISIPLRAFRWPDWVDEAFGLVNIPPDPSLFTVVLLFVLGSALSRRIRFAMWVVFAFQVIAALIAVAIVAVLLFSEPVDVDVPGAASRDVRVGLLLFEGVVGLALCVLFIKARTAFPARLVRGSRIRALAVLIGGLALSAIIATALTEAFPRDLSPGWQRIAWPLRAAIGQLPDESSRAFRGHHGHHWIGALAGVVSAAALIGAAIVFLRSARAKQFVEAQDELELRRLILESGERDSLGYFATRRDKSVIFSPDRRAALTYRVMASVSLASADPLGHVGSWPAAIEAWLAEARNYGWYPAALSASEEGAAAYVAAGLRAMSLGDEAIIDVHVFTLAGPTMAPVRRAVERVRRAGYTVEVARHADLGTEELSRLSGLADTWRSGGDERGFSMALSRLADPADGRCVAVLARDAEGALRGILSFVPWGVRGLSLDLMRRDRAAENGLTEFMVAGLIAACPDLGVRQVSLNFAMFRGIFNACERVGAGPVTRVTGAVLGVASRFWQLESLYRSNAKYLPRWVPRFMCHHPSTSMVRTAIAAGMAEGFLPAPDPMAPRDPMQTVVWHGHDNVPFAEAAIAQAEELLRPARPVQRLTEQERVRRGKIDDLATAGVPAYPVNVARTHSLAQLRAAHPDLAADEHTGEQVSVTGRVRARAQLRRPALRHVAGRGEPAAGHAHRRARGARCRRSVAAHGRPRRLRQRHRRGSHQSAMASCRCWRVNGRWPPNACDPCPTERVGLADPDARVRQRYLDLIVNADTRALMTTRSVAVRALRDGFERRGFAEVETPMLQAVHGGANARPFVTHINAYDTKLYLRIAPELFLKRLCVGGMAKVFELNRNFRNEGADATHNPEFTSLEAYQAWADYHVMRDLTRELILEVATAIHGRPIARRPDDDGTFVEVDLSGSWPDAFRCTRRSAGRVGSSSRRTPPRRRSGPSASTRGYACTPRSTAGAMIMELYDELVEGQTVAPTFYTDFPLESSPLTRVHRDDPRLSERWDLVAFGAEIGTAYSELIDPIDQRERLTTQSMLAAAGDPEAMQIDESFLTALEYAMPPTGGLGLGVDRLVMMLTGTNIRSTLAFPFVRLEPGRS